MNEPSVFMSGSLEEIEQLGMPMNNTHILKDGSLVQHRWVHNAYGALQQRATWNGLHKRDRGQQRPFVLSRSFFFGSQRYGTIWTGDNTASYDDVPLALNTILADGIAGIVFAGADVPGFNNVPDDDIFVQFYQLAAYFPFFRAHTGKNSQNREPWLQSPRV
jgi:alpha 1,3-glucosidase